MVTNKSESKIYKFTDILFSKTLFVGTFFVVYMISPHVMIELSIILAKYLPVLQLHMAGFQI